MRPESSPTTVRRGLAMSRARPAPALGQDRACPRSRQRPPSRRMRLAAFAEKQRRGVGDLGQGRRRHLEDADHPPGRSGSCGRAGCGTGGRARPRNTARCRPCARPRGAGDLALLATWPTRMTAVPRAWQGDQLMRAGADLRDGTGRGLDLVGPERLDRIDDGDIRALGVERGQDVAQPSRRPAAPASPRPSAARACGPARWLPRPRCRWPALPVRAKARRPCSSSVDLPMPGSPPTRIADPGTRPPPSTRSSSAMRDWARGRGLLRRKARQRHRLALEGAQGRVGPG